VLTPTTSATGGPTSTHVFQHLQTLQQPLQHPQVSNRQQQQWPNQPPAADEGDDTHLDSAGAADDDLDGKDDDLGADPGDLDPDDPGDEPADEPAPADGISQALKAERRRTNQLERELRTMRRRLARFSEINPDEYAHLTLERRAQARGVPT
jgi:hypothetical protein